MEAFAELVEMIDERLAEVNDEIPKLEAALDALTTVKRITAEPEVNDAGYGVKADGTPRKRPGRQPARRTTGLELPITGQRDLVTLAAIA